MRNINLFVEDFGHEAFLDALVRRFARQYNMLIEIKFGSSRGGYGAAVGELKKYIRYLQRGKESLPDLIIAATDGNCKGFSERKQQIDEATKGFSELIVCAIPDPHIERWLLLDSAAFKKVLGKGCAAPSQKCERDLYKHLLITAVRNTGREPLFDGMEYAEALIDAMDLEYLERTEESFGRLLRALRYKFQEWERIEHGGSQELREDHAPYALPTETESPQP